MTAFTNIGMIRWCDVVLVKSNFRSIKNWTVCRVKSRYGNDFPRSSIEYSNEGCLLNINRSLEYSLARSKFNSSIKSKKKYLSLLNWTNFLFPLNFRVKENQLIKIISILTIIWPIFQNNTVTVPCSISNKIWNEKKRTIHVKELIRFWRLFFPYYF